MNLRASTGSRSIFYHTGTLLSVSLYVSVCHYSPGHFLSVFPFLDTCILYFENYSTNNYSITVKTLNIGTPRPATVVVLNIKQFNFTMK